MREKGEGKEGGGGEFNLIERTLIPLFTKQSDRTNNYSEKPSQTATTLHNEE